MAMALVGRVMDSIPGNLAAEYAAPLVRWQDRAARLGFNLGSVPGTIEHHFHGSKQKRRYVERWDILQKWHFDPQLDLIKNEFGVVELAGNKPGLRMDIERYFSERDEDANSL
jgi:hypothetical protein